MFCGMLDLLDGPGIFVVMAIEFLGG